MLNVVHVLIEKVDFSNENVYVLRIRRTMSDLKKQKEKTDGKGWGAVDFARESPFSIVPGTVKKVKELIKKAKDKKDKKKRGPRDE